ncbi:MAG: SCP2 sterol-binding domain-containing protein [Deltaproteobacteria bacterium]|nr:SCP2 sterol-binding domain-containing protein [Deltaproteobacteria bacterium]
MAVFESREKLKEVLGGLFDILLNDPKAGPKFASAGITVKFNISDPNAELFITPGDGKKGKIIWDAGDIKANVEMTLSADTCHKFWLRQIGMPVALAKGLIRAKGPMPQVLKLMPLLKPAYDAYPEWAESKGMPVN